MGSCLRVPCGFPSADVRHGCHCTLLLRGRQSSLGMAQGQVLVIHVRTAGGLIGHAHFRQVFPYCSDHIPCIGFGMSDVADIPKPLVGQGLSSHTINRSNLTRAAIPVRTRLARCKRHDGRVGIARVLCHHLFVPYGSDFIQECLSASRLRMPCSVMSESYLWFPFCRRKARLTLYLTLTWPTVLTGDGAGSGTGLTCRNCGWPFWSRTLPASIPILLRPYPTHRVRYVRRG